MLYLTDELNTIRSFPNVITLLALIKLIVLLSILIPHVPYGMSMNNVLVTFLKLNFSVNRLYIASNKNMVIKPAIYCNME